MSPHRSRGCALRSLAGASGTLPAQSAPVHRRQRPRGQSTDVVGVAPGPVRTKLHCEHRFFRGDLDDDAGLVVDRLPLDRSPSERGDGVGLLDGEVEPDGIPSSPVCDTRGGRSSTMRSRSPSMMFSRSNAVAMVTRSRMCHAIRAPRAGQTRRAPLREAARDRRDRRRDRWARRGSARACLPTPAPGAFLLESPRDEPCDGRVPHWVAGGFRFCQPQHATDESVFGDEVVVQHDPSRRGGRRVREPVAQDLGSPTAPGPRRCGARSLDG